MRRRTIDITEYKRTGGDGDEDNIVGMWWGWVKLFYRVIVYCKPLTNLSALFIKAVASLMN